MPGPDRQEPDFPRDEPRLDRFDQRGLRHQTARGAIAAIGVCALVLMLIAGDSVKAAGEREQPGFARTALIVLGTPPDLVASVLPFDEAADDAGEVVSPDEGSEQPGFADAEAQAGDPAAIAPITEQNFDQTALGNPPSDPPALETLLVTGDSLSTPMDTHISRQLTERGIDVITDPHLASGISNTAVADWASIARGQVAEDAPDATVMFIGANEGYPFDGPEGDVACCGSDWAAIFARRARELMDIYRQQGAARVYWMVVPAPRDDDHAEVTRTVNSAVDIASYPWRSHVHLIDLAGIFTPGDEYRDTIDVDGEETIVRDPDGIHLNDRGAQIAADAVVDRIELDFETGG